MTDFLDQIFSVYTQSSDKIEAPKGSSDPIRFGDIVEIYAHNQLLVCAAISDSEGLLMSEFWELATNTDMIVELDHPIASKWMIETDKRLYLTGKEIYRITSRLNENDRTILKDIILNGRPVPIQKSGPKIPPNPKDPRMKFKLEELEKTMLVNKHLFYEEEEEGT